MELWNNIEKLLKVRVSLEIKFSRFSIILDVLIKHHISINNLFLRTNKFLFDISRDGRRLSLKPLKQRLNSLFRDKEYHAKLNVKRNRVFSCFGSVSICVKECVIELYNFSKMEKYGLSFNFYSNC